MRRLAALVAIFTIIGSNAWAFDRSHEVVGQMYFSIPFGAATKQQATPRLGFRVGFGEASTFADRNAADRSARAPYGVLEWQASLDGRTALLINGIDVAELSRALYAAEDGGQTDGDVSTAVWIGLGIVVVGGLGYLVYKRAEDCAGAFRKDPC